LDQSGSLRRDGNGLEEGWNVLESESESERKRREFSRKKRTLTTKVESYKATSITWLNQHNTGNN
jgi:hypothetical protein